MNGFLRYKRRGGSLEYWVKAIEKARQEGLKTASQLVGRWKRVLPLVRSRLDTMTPFQGKVYMLQYTGSGPLARHYEEALSSVFYGVDSSIVKPIRVGYRYVGFVSAATIRLRPQARGRAEIVHLDVEPVEAPEAGDLSSYRVEFTIQMFRREVEALREARVDAARLEGSKVVVLDGPLVDPPALASKLQGHSGLREVAVDLVRRRAEHLAVMYKQGVPVVGFVKRLQGSIFVDEYLEDDTMEGRGRIGDLFLSLLLAHAIVERAEKYGICDAGDKVVIVSKPIQLRATHAGDVPFYEEVLSDVAGEARIYTSLYMPLYCDGNRRRPARIEFIATPETAESEAARIAAMLEAVTLPGSFLPEPVLLAHRSCTIRRREGRKLLREVMSRHALEALQRDAPVLLDLLGE